MNLSEIFRANMIRAVGTSDLSLDEISASTGIPLRTLEDEIQGGGDELDVEAAHRVYLALYPDDPLRFHEWFDEPWTLSPTQFP